MANLVGDGDNGDSLVDEKELIQTLQQPELEDYTDPNWKPDPIDVSPAVRTSLFFAGLETKSDAPSAEEDRGASVFAYPKHGLC